MQTDQSEELDISGLEEQEVDPLAGQEMFDVPEDLADSDAGAPAAEQGADPKGPPAAGQEATQPRDDETGKFLPKPETGTAEGAAAPPQGQPPEGAPAVPAPTAQAPESEGELEPEFSFTADRQPITVKGSKLTKDWLMIPRERTPDIQRLLSYGVTYQGSFRQRLEQAEREKLEARTEVHENVVRAEATLNFFADMLDRQAQYEADGGDPLDQEAPIAKWLGDFQRNRVRLEADATLAAAKALQNKPAIQDVQVPGFEDDDADSYMSEHDRQELHNNLSSELTTRVQGIAVRSGIRGLTPAETTRIIQAMTDPEEIDRYFSVALEDIPEHGIQKGSIVAMDAKMEKVFRHQAQLILDARQSSAQLATAAAANARNGNAPKIPPTTPVTGAEAPKGSKQPPKFKSKAEMDAWFDSSEGDPE